MGKVKKKNKLFFYYKVIFILIFSFLSIFIFSNYKEENLKSNKINFKLITSTHENLPWEFKPLNSTIEIKIGEITNIEYVVKNLSSSKTSGVASFAYYPRELDLYINKIKCFCYEVKTLNAGEEDNYILTMMIDPMATKDSKTKTIKEAIIQFTFFNSKDYKDNNS